MGIINNRKIIAKLAFNDFKTKYAGSYLGVFWAFVQPIITVLVYWFVFEVGFRDGTTREFPFVVWLTAGMVPWFYFSESWMGATSSLFEYSYLVKKVVFKIDVLPIIKIISSLFVHAFFIVVYICLCAAYGYCPSLYTIQIFYYVICEVCLLMGLSYLTSAIMVFFKDLGQIINIIMQIGMWMTPIMWDYHMLPEKYWFILRLNPVYYIVQGFRNSLLENVWFWERWKWTLYFWIVISVLFILGTSVFKKLQKHFADVL